MAEDLGNISMEALLTEFTELVKNSVRDHFPQRDKLEGMTTILEEVTEELKTYCSNWKIATQQAEDGAKQVAEKNEELEEKRKQIEIQEEQLSRRTLDLEAKERLFEIRRIDLEKKEELLQRFQPTVIETLRELTEADSKTEADLSKAQADAQRSHVNYRVSHFEEIWAKRGLGPTSPEKPLPKRRRLTDTSGTASTLSGGRGSLGSSMGLQNALYSEPSSSMNPATGAGQPNPASSSPRTLLNSSQSGVSATDPPGLSEASDEVKRVWRQIDFPADWEMATSNLLLQGFNKNISKKIPAKYRPAGLLDLSFAQPNCLFRRLSRTKSALDNGDEYRCSECKKGETPCVRVSFVAEDLANVEYDPHSQKKRWKLSIRED